MYRTDWPARVTRCTTVIMAEEAAELNAEIRQFYTAVGVAQYSDKLLEEGFDMIYFYIRKRYITIHQSEN